MEMSVTRLQIPHIQYSVDYESFLKGKMMLIRGYVGCYIESLVSIELTSN